MIIERKRLLGYLHRNNKASSIERLTQSQNIRLFDQNGFGKKITILKLEKRWISSKQKQFQEACLTINRTLSSRL